MGLSGMYNAPLPEEVGISIIKEAYSKGITFFDTADVYGPHTNEILVGKVSFEMFFLRFFHNMLSCKRIGQYNMVSSFL
jgi:predicted oxidoreductase